MLLLATMGLVLGLATPASAHTALAGMTPANGSSVTTAPTEVVLTFDEAVEDLGAAVVVTAPSGARVDSGKAVVDGARVSEQLTALTENGRYTVAFRVVADDGHPVTGTQTFDLAATGPSPSGSGSSVVSSPTTASSSPGLPAPGVSSSQASASGDGTSPIGPMVAGALVMLVAASVLVVVAWRRGRS
jgi:copper resistance protein C